MASPSSSKSVSGFLVAAARAQAVAEQQDVEDQVKLKAREKEDQDIEKKKQSALEVNRALHSALSRRQAELAAFTKDVESLELKLESRELEDPCRGSRVAELQTELSQDKVKSRTGKEAERLASRVAQLESKIEDLNADNLRLSDLHRSDRTQLQEQQSRLRTLGRRERELAKQLDVISEALNEHMALAARRGDPGPAVDFRNLPGLRLEKLIDGLRQGPPAAGQPELGPKDILAQQLGPKDVSPRVTVRNDNEADIGSPGTELSVEEKGSSPLRKALSPQSLERLGHEEQLSQSPSPRARVAISVPGEER